MIRLLIHGRCRGRVYRFKKVYVWCKRDKLCIISEVDVNMPLQCRYDV